MKRILVSMSTECAAVLKQYAALWGVTQSEVLYQSARQFIHSQAAHGCQNVQGILESHNIALDKRAHKSCYGSGCFCCEHIGRCRIGSYDGEWEMALRYRNLLPPNMESEQ